MDVLKELKSQLKENESNIKKLTRQLRSAPEGTIMINTKGQYRNYYHVKDQIRTYISKSNIALAKKLAQKTYNNKCLSILQEEQNAIDHFLKNYDPDKKYLLYEQMPESRKELIEPIKTPAQLKYEAWLSEPYSPYEAFSDNQRFQTDRGEMVRSKSEVIIANFLHSQKDVLDYRYEQGLWMRSAGTQFHPDYTIFFKNSGRILYHEHFGMMDDPDYANDFTWKYEQYLLSGFLPGRDFIFTCESSTHPFSIKGFKEVIQMILKNE